MPLDTPCPSLPCPVPSRQELYRFLESLLDVVFPEFFHMPKGSYRRHLLSLAPSLHAALEYSRHAQQEQACEETVGQKVEEVMNELVAFEDEFRSLLESDVDAAYEGDPAARDAVEILLAYPAMGALAVQRFAHRLYSLQVPLLPRMMTEWTHARTGIDIHPGAHIGRSFFIDHGTGVVIGETCVIGERVKLYQGVTLGALSFPRDVDGSLKRDAKRHPTIEDDVVVYANATILGGDTLVGHHSTVGASAFLMDSVPAHSLILVREPETKLVRRSKLRPDGESGSMESAGL